MAFRSFHIKEQPFNWAKKYIINDEEGNEIYYGRKKMLSFYDQTRIFDSFDEEIYEIRKKPFSLKSVFYILKSGKKVFRVFKKIVTIHPEIYIESLTDIDAFYVQGDLWQHEYSFFTEGQKFASVSKKFLSFTDNYGIQIEEGHDERLVLAVVLVIDLMRKKEK